MTGREFCLFTAGPLFRACFYKQTLRIPDVFSLIGAGVGVPLLRGWPAVRVLVGVFL
jgi:hypothetical protein